MPAKPRRLEPRRAPELRRDVELRPEVRRDRLVVEERPLAVERRDDVDDRPREPDRERVERDLLDELERDLLRLELDRPDDFLPPDLPRCALVSPFLRRILFTVRAATSSARPPYRPDFFALCLMCWYCRSRFGLAPAGIDISSLPDSFGIMYC